MRVITGSARGTRLEAPPGLSTRPTSEMCKEAVFSILHFELAEARVLDLFAGSGQLGIEALSRGAVTCDFVDASPEAFAVVRENCRAARVEMKSKLHNCDAFAFLAAARGPFDLVLLDPPFGHDTLARVLPELSRIVAPGGVVLCESEREAFLPETAGELARARQYTYGRILVTRYEKRAQD